MVIIIIIQADVSLNPLLKILIDEEYKEKDLVCLTNRGDVVVFSVPHLRPQLKAGLLTKEGTLLVAYILHNLCM